MGVAELIFLSYRDSGMAGTPENPDPRAFINAPAEEVVQQLVAVIRRLKPAVVATFEPNGGYGHPDHIAIHRHTVQAFHLAADPGYCPDLGESWQASRLYYSALPRSFFLEIRRLMIEMGMDTQELDTFGDGSGGWPDEEINVVVDVSSTVGDKWQALHCHRTQFGPGNLFRRISEEHVKQLMSKEYFSLVWPEPPPGTALTGLFAGLPADS
jgi:LmbE family N-acetylglucosaminyl deacetylase